MITLWRPRRSLVAVVALLALLALAVAWRAQPGDSRLRLALRFNLARLTAQARRVDAQLLRSPARHPVDLATDVGFVIKTGYGTRHRLPDQVDVLSRRGVLGPEGRGFIVVGDWTAANASDARRLGVGVLDAIGMVLETKVDAQHRQHPRFAKYASMKAAVAAGDEEKALRLGQTYGWELDALKFIMGMELAYVRLPGKKWYVILDDDTYLVKPSLELLLGHVDPSKARYIGNAVGDWKARFAHGGSAVLLSGEATRALFGRADVVAQAYSDSMDETLGDRLVATTLQKAGIYMDEGYSHLFSGEPPEQARIRGDRVCSPVVSFHGLRAAGAMARVGAKLAAVDEAVLWGQLWALFGDGDEVARRGGKPYATVDHVGPDGEGTTSWAGVGDEDECRARCEAAAPWCVAWRFARDAGECVGSPWAIIGDGGGGGDGPRVSGISWQRMKPLAHQCRPAS